MLHIRKLNSRRWDYFLTPRGVTEKARLTYEFLGFTMQFYREARRRSAEVLAQASKAGVKRIALLGANELAEIASLGAQEWGLEIVDVFDPSPAGKAFLGRPVRPTSEVEHTSAQQILVTAFDPAEPMARHYMPAGVEADPRLVWIFDLPDQEPTPPANHEARSGSAPKQRKENL